MISVVLAKHNALLFSIRRRRRKMDKVANEEEEEEEEEREQKQHGTAMVWTYWTQ